MRLFVAIPMPEAVRAAVAPAMEGGPPGLRWICEDDLHLTLRFIGEVEPPMADRIARRLAAIKAPVLEARIDGVGVFDHRRRGALWARLAPKPPLEALHQKIDRSVELAGFKPTRRAFIPHVTLARWSGGSIAHRAWAERWAGLASPRFSLARFTLFESRLTHAGAHYTPLADFALDEGRG